MKQSFNNLTKKEKEFLSAILDKGSVSDAEISKKTGISKPTCSRLRKKLEKNLIEEYIPIIPLDRAGIDIFVVLMLKWNRFNDDKLTRETYEAWENDPRVVFLANGQGNPYSTIMFLGFRNINEYHEYFSGFQKKHDHNVSNLNSMIFPSKEVIKMDFTEILKFVLDGGEV